MSEVLFQDIVDSLDDLLDAERAALLKGDLDKVARLTTEKETLIEQLTQSKSRDAVVLRQLDDRLKRNQVLLDAALDGLRRVARRLSALRRVRSALDTYDSRGERRTIDIGSENGFEKRA